MKQYTTIIDFVNALTKATAGKTQVRLLSIGCTSDGYYTLRCVDEYSHEHVFKVPCWED